MVFLWVLSWILLPATLATAVIMGFWRGLHPDLPGLRKSILTLAVLLVACLVPRLVAAPQVRPYPTPPEVVQSFAIVTGIGLFAALLAFGLGRGIRWLLRTR